MKQNGQLAVIYIEECGITKQYKGKKLNLILTEEERKTISTSNNAKNSVLKIF